MFSNVIDFLSGGGIGGTVASIGLSVLGKAIGGDEQEQQGSGFAQQRDLSDIKSKSLQHAHNLRRLGGVYEQMKYGRGQGASRQQRSDALRNWLSQMERIQLANPYYSRYRKIAQGGGQHTMSKIADPLSERSDEIYGQAGISVRAGTFRTG